MSSKSDSDSKRARKPTDHRKSLPTRATRSDGLVFVEIVVGIFMCPRSVLSSRFVTANNRIQPLKAPGGWERMIQRASRSSYYRDFVIPP